MNVDDESYLSAYLDDELDPSDRATIEWAIESDPALRERFLALGRTRSELRDLPPPRLPLDLSGPILAQLPRHRIALKPRTIYRSALWAAAAASVLLAVLVSNRQFGPKPNQQASLPPRINHGPALVAHADSSTPAAIEENSPPNGTSPATVAAAAESKAPVVVDSIHEPADRERLLTLLDRPNLHRVLIPIDMVGDQAIERVNDIVRESARRDSDYARLTVAQGIVIDPALPNQAELFVVVVSEAERKLLMENLKKEFPETEDESISSSETPALLAEVGKISILPGKSAAGLLDLPTNDAVATKFHHPVPPDATGSDHGHPGLAGGSDRTTSGSARSESTSASPSSRPGSAECTLLVWVTHRGNAED